MGVKIVDSSAVAAILFGEREGEFIAAALEGESLVTCALLRFEVADVCIKKMHHYPAKAAELVGAFGFLEQMDLDIREVKMDEVVLIADKAGLTANDVAYLWLSRTYSADLVTLDSNLSRASQSLQWSSAREPKWGPAAGRILFSYLLRIPTCSSPSKIPADLTSSPAVPGPPFFHAKRSLAALWLSYGLEPATFTNCALDQELSNFILFCRVCRSVTATLELLLKRGIRRRYPMPEFTE
ncbi:MAG: type II toxin-antitoxin system VapC family toxin [Acidobacteriia bacterium]|nr:type II toxin-antitoxin system VapC family toxin [Terriglobia bacterium]